MSTNVLLAFMLGALPISEIRGGALYVFATSSDTFTASIGLLASLTGNLLVPFMAYGVLDLLDAAFRSKYTPSIVKRAYLMILEHGRRRARNVKSGGYIALALFVGIPLPVTGAWTGTLVAYVLGLSRKKSIVAIELGVLLATVVVTLTFLLGLEILRRIFLL